MLCIECPLYKFDGHEFRCPATSWCVVRRGMFRSPGATCPYRDGYIRQISGELSDLRKHITYTLRHVNAASELLCHIDASSNLAEILRAYIDEQERHRKRYRVRCIVLERQLNELGGLNHGTKKRLKK